MSWAAPDGAPPEALAPTPPRVHVTGTARIDAHAARGKGRLFLSGVLVDDTGRPITGARVTVAIARASAASSTIALASASPEECSDRAAQPVLDRGDLLSLPADAAGRFCVRLSLAVDRYLVHLQSSATGLVDGTRLDLPVDLALEPITLRFDPEPPMLSLDDEGAALEVVASIEDDGVTRAAVGLPLSLSNETAATLGTAITNASGRARFAVDGARLGPPGKGELRVSFAGSAEAGASAHATEVERRTHVALSAPDDVDGRLPAGSPEEGVAVRVRATTRCAARGCVASPTGPTGTVEARVGDVLVGAAPLDHGEARVVLTFGMPAANEIVVHFAYLPDAPWFLAGGDMASTLPLRAPSPWKKLPLALAGLAVIGWLFLARLPRRKSAEAAPTSGRTPLRQPQAGVELLRRDPRAQGWTGTVRDAHDGFGVGAARVAVERRGFLGVEVLIEALCDTAGRFALPPVEPHPGDLLVAEGALHATVRRPLPPSGELDVALVLRKRVLLDGLVAWARARGRPYDAQPEPTPAHVRRAAASGPVVRWADAVERAAYGEGVIDEGAQGEVDRLAPPNAEAGDAVVLAGEGPRSPPRPGPR